MTKKKTTLTRLQMYSRNDSIFFITSVATFPVTFGTIAIMEYVNKFMNGLGDILFFTIMLAWLIFTWHSMNIAFIDYDDWVELYDKKYEYVGDENNETK